MGYVITRPNTEELLRRVIENEGYVKGKYSRSLYGMEGYELAYSLEAGPVISRNTCQHEDPTIVKLVIVRY